MSPRSIMSPVMLVLGGGRGSRRGCTVGQHSNKAQPKRLCWVFVGLSKTRHACLAFPPTRNKSDSFRPIKGNNRQRPASPPALLLLFLPLRGAKPGSSGSQNQFAGLVAHRVCACACCASGPAAEARGARHRGAAPALPASSRKHQQLQEPLPSPSGADSSGSGGTGVRKHLAKSCCDPLLLIEVS